MCTHSHNMQSMFWIVVHHQVMWFIWKEVIDAGDEGWIQDVCGEESLHDPFKDADLALSLLADASPNMYFDWMLGLGLRLWALSLLSTAESTVILQLQSTLISPQNILKVVVPILVSPLQPLLLIGISNQLAVCTTTNCPPQCCPTSQDCSQRYVDSIVQQHSVKLCGCWFVVKLHFLIYKFLHCGSNLG